MGELLFNMKRDFETPEFTSENIEKIASLFPNCVTEMCDENGKIKRGINFGMLKQMLSPDVVDGDEHYEFTWVGKRASIVEANKPIRKTLCPCPEESKNWDTTGNLYIEGDNLEVLKLLQKAYLGKVKMIYIDPPYNTGKNLIYKDKFYMSIKEYKKHCGNSDDIDLSGRFHSDWCSMLYSRLMLARNLLADDGVILVNMDENEITNLQNLCAETFGSSNDLGTIVWDKRNPKGDAKGISYQHEYILVYAKNKVTLTNKCKIQRPKKNAGAILKKAAQLYKKISKDYTLEEANADFAAWIRAQNDFSGGEKAYNKIDSNGNVYRPVSMAWPNKKKAPDDYFVPLVHPLTHKPCPVPERGWRNPSATMKRMQEQGLILFGKDESTIPNCKYLLKDNIYENIPSVLYYGGSDTELLSQMGIPFETPKVVGICIEHIQSFTEKEDIILDFFSGSATTAHAVMQLNAEDGGHRKFIMVQIPQSTEKTNEFAYKAGYKNICEIGKERIRRAGDKIKAEHPDVDLDIGFRVLKLDDSNIKEDRTDLNLLFSCLLDWGLPLSMPYKSEQIDGCTVHTYNDGDLIACFDPNVPESVVKEIAQRKPLRAVFRDSSITNSFHNLCECEVRVVDK